MYCLEPLKPIETIDDLHYNLQLAIELEFSTLPVYLTSLYSIHEGSNGSASVLIRSVVMEEMFHLTNAANVLIATGGSPALNDPQFLPSFPTYLPDGEKWFQAELLKFSHQALDIFLDIEMPGDLVPTELITIGDFYENIEKGLNLLHRQYGDELFLRGSPEHQIEHKYYYGGGGVINKVFDLDSAMFALNAIIAQGEGAPSDKWDPDEPFPLDDTTGIMSGNHELFMQPRKLAHYYRFNELRQGRRYVRGDSHSSGPTGPRIPIDYHRVYNIKPNPQKGDYAQWPEIAAMDHQVNVIFSTLLDQLHEAFNGHPARLENAVGTMFSLKYQVQSLMAVPLPGDPQNQHAAPTWQYLSPQQREAS